MSKARPAEAVTEEAYLRAEREADGKREFEAGVVHAMSGASDAHNTIALNLATALRAHLRKGPCRLYVADMRVHVAAANAYYYPDLLVSCEPEDARLAYFKERPKVIVEILSPSTELRDRGNKFESYRSLPSLQEYILVSQHRMQIERYRHDGDRDRWIYQTFGEEDTFTIDSLEFSLAVKELYEDVSFDTAETEPEDLNL